MIVYEGALATRGEGDHVEHADDDDDNEDDDDDVEDIEDGYRRRQGPGQPRGERLWDDREGDARDGEDDAGEGREDREDGANCGGDAARRDGLLEERSKAEDDAEDDEKEPRRGGRRRRRGKRNKDATKKAVGGVEETLAARLGEAAKIGDVQATKAALDAFAEAVEKEEDQDAAKTRTRVGIAALGWAAGGGHVEVIKMLAEDKSLLLDPDMPDPADKLGRTALHWAARKGQLEAVKTLVEDYAVDQNACMKEGTSVFHYAVYGNAEAVCEYLRLHGADVHHINQHGCNAAQWAALTGSCAMFEYLGGTCGLDLNVRSKNGHTILHKAAQRGHLDACQWLAAKVPHLREVRDIQGSTAAELAGLNEHTSVAEFLSGTFAEDEMAEDVEDKA